MHHVILVGTLDTKGPEFAFLKAQVERGGCSTIVIDTGILGGPFFPPDITRAQAAQAAGVPLEELVKKNDRGYAVTMMAKGAAAVVGKLFKEGKADGIVSLGGSAGTTIGTSCMRVLPVGVPKLMVSTLASGDTNPFVGTKDIAMLYSVVDIAGINRISARVISNAAAAITGQVKTPPPELEEDKQLIAATMFGVTTPCIEEARKHLPAGSFETIVFHATGTGGKAMEDLIAGGFFSGVLDITTTEWADQIVGGIMPGGPDRLSAAARAGIPQVISTGACDMVNFGPLATVPEQFRSRNLYVHNDNVTLMRTTAEECSRIGEAMAENIAAAAGKTAVLLPLEGVSAIDKHGEVFYDPEADRALFNAIKANLASRPDITVTECACHINDPAFARQAAETLLALIEKGENP